jgi:hypothetical protein
MHSGSDMSDARSVGRPPVAILRKTKNTKLGCLGSKETHSITNLKVVTLAGFCMNFFQI